MVSFPLYTLQKTCHNQLLNCSVQNRQLTCGSRPNFLWWAETPPIFLRQHSFLVSPGSRQALAVFLQIHTHTHTCTFLYLSGRSRSHGTTPAPLAKPKGPLFEYYLGSPPVNKAVSFVSLLSSCCPGFEVCFVLFVKGRAFCFLTEYLVCLTCERHWYYVDKIAYPNQALCKTL